MILRHIQLVVVAFTISSHALFVPRVDLPAMACFVNGRHAHIAQAKFVYQFLIRSILLFGGVLQIILHLNINYLWSRWIASGLWALVTTILTIPYILVKPTMLLSF